MAPLPVGNFAPDFAATSADGSEIRLRSLRGQFVVVYFYPKDFTGGCNAEACSFNDALPDFDQCGATVIGVSSQRHKTHDRFRAKFGLKFPLAADIDHGIAEDYGVGKLYGLLPLHARVSFLIDPDGKIAKVWENVNPAGHAADVLGAIREQAVRRTQLPGEAAQRGRSSGSTPVAP